MILIGLKFCVCKPLLFRVNCGYLQISNLSLYSKMGETWSILPVRPSGMSWIPLCRKNADPVIIALCLRACLPMHSQARPTRSLRTSKGTVCDVRSIGRTLYSKRDVVLFCDFFLVLITRACCEFKRFWREALLNGLGQF